MSCTWAVCDTIERVLEKVDRVIEEKNVTQLFSRAIGLECVKMVVGCGDQVSVNWDFGSSMREESLSEVPRIGKDSFMAKDIIPKEVSPS